MAQKGMKPSAMIKQRLGNKSKVVKEKMPKVASTKTKKDLKPKVMTQEEAQRRALDKLMKKRMGVVKKTGVYPNYKTN